MWRDKLESVVKLMGEHSYPIHAPATKKEISTFIGQVHQKYAVSLPVAYLEFLQLHNSLEFDGMILYGIDEVLNGDADEDSYLGFMYQNDVVRIDSDIHGLVLFGEADMENYVYCKDTNMFYCLDKGVLDVMEAFGTFHTFEDMLIAVFDKMLK